MSASGKENPKKRGLEKVRVMSKKGNGKWSIKRKKRKGGKRR